MSKTPPDSDQLATDIREIMLEHDQDIPSTSLRVDFAVAIRPRRRRSPLIAAAAVTIAVVAVLMGVTTAAHRNSPDNAAPPAAITEPAPAPPVATHPVTTPTGTTPTVTEPGGTEHGGTISQDGVLQFRGIHMTVPQPWVHASYSTPCGHPTTDYVLIVTQPSAPVPDCLPVLKEPIYGIVVASSDVAGSWLDTAAATKTIELDGLTGLTGIDRRGDTVVVLPGPGVAFTIHAPATTVRAVLASLRQDR